MALDKYGYEVDQQYIVAVLTTSTWAVAKRYMYDAANRQGIMNTNGSRHDHRVTMAGASKNSGQRIIRRMAKLRSESCDEVVEDDSGGMGNKGIAVLDERLQPRSRGLC
jgi:hypothetical protein